MAVGYDSADLSKPPQIMTVPDQFMSSIGKIIVQWGILEQEMDILMTVTIPINKSLRPGWERLAFTKRWRAFKEEWAVFIAGDPPLTADFAQTEREMLSAKPLRDSFAHKRIFAGLEQDRPFLRFESENKTFPWSKRYYLEDFDDAARKISNASGRLYRLTNHKFAQHLPSQSKSILQRLPDVDYLRHPTPKGKKPPRQP